MSTLQVQSIEELNEHVLNLSGDERIILSIEEDDCKKIKYLHFQKEAYNNLFLSYINNTREEANKINLDEFLHKFTQLHVDAFEKTKEVTIKKIGVDLFNYIMDVRTDADYYIDFDRNLLVISRNSRRRVMKSCGC